MWSSAGILPAHPPWTTKTPLQQQQPTATSSRQQARPVQHACNAFCSSLEVFLLAPPRGSNLPMTTIQPLSRIHITSFPYCTGGPPAGMSLQAWGHVIFRRHPRPPLGSDVYLALDVFNILQRHMVLQHALRFRICLPECLFFEIK